MTEIDREARTFELKLVNESGRFYTGRITGREIAMNEQTGVVVYLTDDDRVLVYDGAQADVMTVMNPDTELEGLLSPGEYAAAMAALGISVVVDL